MEWIMPIATLILCVEKGVMSGSIGNIRPNDATTRAEAAAMITR